MKLYGNLINRLQENRNYTNEPIHEGMDITKYYWSDRTCYFVTKVIDQKHIFIKKYQICADHSKEGGMGHQNWLYFKTTKEMNEYLNKCIDEGLINYPGVKKYETENIQEDSEIELVYRYGHWYAKYDYWYDVKLEKPQYDKWNISFGIKDYYYDWEF